MTVMDIITAVTMQSATGTPPFIELPLWAWCPTVYFFTRDSFNLCNKPARKLYDPHFTDEETEAPKGQCLYQGHVAAEWLAGLGLISGFL